MLGSGGRNPERAASKALPRFCQVGWQTIRTRKYTTRGDQVKGRTLIHASGVTALLALLFAG